MPRSSQAEVRVIVPSIWIKLLRVDQFVAARTRLRAAIHAATGSSGNG
jgi:hypothetical protein